MARVVDDIDSAIVCVVVLLTYVVYCHIQTLMRHSSSMQSTCSVTVEYDDYTSPAKEIRIDTGIL